MSATAPTRQGAVDRRAEKVAAFERDQDVELTASTSLAGYLAWWTAVELLGAVVGDARSAARLG